MDPEILQHPHYADGYWDAMAREPPFPDASPEYRYGWENAIAAKIALGFYGFTEPATGVFSQTMTVRGKEAGEL